MGYFIKVEQNIKIYVEDLNPSSHDTIVFLHGWPLNHKLFEYQLNVLPDMGFRCIAIDMRGFGKSDKPWTGYEYDRLADDLCKIIQTLQLKQVTLVGHSMAGAIALRYMARYHGYEVSRLCLVSAAAPFGFTKETAADLYTKSSRDRPRMLEEISDIFFFQHSSRSFSDWFIQLGLKAAGWSTLKTILSLRDENVLADLGLIQVSTLIIHGIHDQVIPFSQSNIVHQEIRNSILLPFQFSGHGPVWEERNRFNQVLVNFIRGL